MQSSLLVLKDLNVSVVTTCLHVSQLVPPDDLQQSFFSKDYFATFALTRMSFKVLVLLNPIIGIISKTYHVFCQVLVVSAVLILNF